MNTILKVIAINLVTGLVLGFTIGFGVRGTPAGTASASTRIVEFPDGTSLRFHQPVMRPLSVTSGERYDRSILTTVKTDGAELYIVWRRNCQETK